VRGIVWTGAEAEVTTNLEVRAPLPDEVTVRMVAAGVCHSDVSVLDGTIPFPTPVVLGHEGAGIVEEVGHDVTGVEPGDHVVVATLANCGRCRYCNTGHPTWCRASIGNITQPFTRNGEPVHNFAATSSFADRTVVKAIQAVRIPREIPLASACLMACGVITGVGAVLNRARVQPGETAAVFGVGGVGLNVIQGLRLSQAARIVAVDMLASKEQLAMEFGATDFVDASATDAVAAVRELLPPPPGTPSWAFSAGGVDWAFECAGHAGALRNAVDVLDWGGTCVAVGVPPAGQELQVPITPFVHVDRGLIGSRYGSARPQHDIPLLAELYLKGELKLDELVTRTYPLDAFDRVVHDMENGILARGVLEF
jgi:Zn-dependent alcohol dehydrogenase